jgi:hypothetical protein
VRLKSPPTSTEPDVPTLDPTEPDESISNSIEPDVPASNSAESVVPASNPIAHFLASIEELFEYTLRNVEDSDMVGIAIRNEENQNDKAIGLSFRRKDQISADVIWSVFEKVSQSNSRFNALDKLVIEVHYVKMPAGFGHSLKTKGRPMDDTAKDKRSIVRVTAEENCLAHAIIIAVAKLTNDPYYKSYRSGRKMILPVVQNLLAETGIDLSKGGGLPELAWFQEHLKNYRIVVYEGFSCDRMMFDGQTDSQQRINLLYDDVTRHYHVINSLTGALMRNYVCTACNKGCKWGITHTCDQTCSDCMASPPCIQKQGVRIPCNDCNRTFRSQSCYDNHKAGSSTKKSLCEIKKLCSTCGRIVYADMTGSV